MKSLASKFNLVTILLIIVTTILSSAFVVWQYQLNAVKNFTQYSEKTALLLAKNIEHAVLGKNPQKIALALRGLRANSDISYIAIYSIDHTLLFKKNYLDLSHLPAITDHTNSEFNKDLVSDIFQSSKNNNSSINIIAPLFFPSKTNPGDNANKLKANTPELIGYLQLGINLDTIYEDIRQFTQHALFVISGIILISILFSIWQTRQIIGPFKKLLTAANSIVKGNRADKLIPSTKDEVTELSLAFKTILKKLSQYQSELSKQNISIEELVTARTQALQNKSDEANQFAKQAELTSKAKSDFLATMSHEIRTPMNGVLGMTELLLNTELNARQKRLADTAYRSAESLLGVINNILDFSKIEYGQFQLNVTDFDLRNLLEDTAEILSTQARSKDLELILNLPIDLSGIFLGDSERLRQILINLLGNAIKFTQHGEVQLKVDYNQKIKNNSAIELSFEISDTGPGIELEHQALIFESFIQADSSITRKYGGTGLGLSISKQLVEMMGGELKLSSVLGQGSSFSFSFSLCLERSAHLATPKADITALQGIKILVVDDNATNREILSDQLNHWGIDCYCVASGAQAVTHLLDATKQNKFYQAALLDWHMPEMDGLTLAKTLYANTDVPPLPVVMLSSDTITFDRHKGINYGISHFLNKPVIQQKLLNCLLELIGSIENNPDKQLKSFAHKKTNLSGHVLLAEDNPVNQEVGLAILRTIGCRADIVSNGLEAFEASKNNHYDAILMDCHMPEVDGFQATNQIREYEASQDKQHRTPIIALTADVQKGIVNQCINAGMDGYLSKPFNRKQLLEALQKWLPFKYDDLEHFASDENALVSQSTVHILDTTILSNLRQLTTESGEPLLNRAVTLFLKSAPKDVDALQLAFDQQQSAALSNIAHRFKSTCANLGAQTLEDGCASIESISNKGQTKGIDGYLAKIQSDLPIVMAALKEVINTSVIEAKPELVRQEPRLEHHNRILLVDDDISFRLITSSTLSASSFIVDEAESGVQALEIVKQHKPDLVLLDAQMDELDGFETCRLLRENPIMTDVPIIMSTGLGDIDSIHRAFEAGATDFIVKPLNYAIVIHRLWFILRASKDSSELRNSKIQLTAAQRMARLGYWIWNVKNNHFEISEQLADLCSINLETFDATLEGFLLLVEPDDLKMVKEMLLEAPYSKTIQHIEYRLQVTKDSSIFVHQEMVKIIENGESIITGTVQDISQRKATEKQIHHLAYFDTLTGLASRTYFHERIQTFIKTADRRKEKFAFLFLDLDGFKDINDSLGHNQGDELLKKIATRVQKEIRDVDFAARLGGDEFCILLSGIIDDASVAEVACRCLEHINKPLILNQQTIRPRVSIGIAIYPRDGENEEQIMKSADTAMYAAKQAGKQCYTFYTRDMALQAISRLEREQMLLEAFEKEQFMLHYQPQISMESGRLIGIEALVRWQHPTEGMVPPDEFIPEIEQLGLVVPLGNWVIKAACEQIAKWQQAGLPYMHVAVNISALHFQDVSLLDTVKNTLAKTNVPAHYLELEVTESAMHVEECLDIIKKLRAIGIKIAIDDFGTGYSCLASLKQLPFDSLKIDKVFVDDMLTNHHTALLLGTIIGLANALDYKIVAEGVENKEQALVMHGLGCHIIQGYLFGRPVCSDEIPKLLDVDFTHQMETEQ